MQARGPLMVEHRLIEQVIRFMRDHLELIVVSGRVDTLAIEECVDFVHVYADRTHHGKEEDILFRRLSRRPLSLQHQAILEELLAEHALARQITRQLAEANVLHRDGDLSSLAVIRSSLETLVELYPRHIEKEDQIFFPALRAYLTEEEDQAMLAEFWEFDRQMIHEKYRAVARGLAAR
jgi:hemerythrin-like domain-containing protein